ncbi:hypothetical protein [Clostridium phage Saumur]|nr:hypothetical protein [Clostridium phage Saumur]
MTGGFFMKFNFNARTLPKILIVSLVLSLLLSGCGGNSAASEKSAELSSKYDYYQKSAENIQDKMGVDPDHADDIFLTLTDCGVSDLINIITPNNDGTYSVWSAGTKYTVSIENSAIATVFLDNDQIYPEQVHHNDLMDYDLIIKDVLNGSGDTVIGQYAYISITGKQLEAMTADNLREFAESRVVDSGYNWVSIIAADGKGICFSGSLPDYGTYGIVDESGVVTEVLGDWILDADGNYTYTEK